MLGEGVKGRICFGDNIEVLRTRTAQHFSVELPASTRDGFLGSP